MALEDVDAHLAALETNDVVSRDAQLKAMVSDMRNRAFLLKTYPTELTALVDRFEFEGQYRAQIEPLLDYDIFRQNVEGDRPGLVYNQDGEERRATVQSFDDILKGMMQRPELLEKFNLFASSEDPTLRPTLEIIPFAADITRELVPALGNATIRHKDHLRPPGDDYRNPRDPLTLKNQKEPVWCWAAYGDPSQIVYFPTQYHRQKHGGRTKPEILRANPRAAIQWTITDGTVDIPRAGRGKSTGSHNGLTRKQLEAGSSPIESLHRLQTDPTHSLERGDIPEAALARALAHMERTKGEVLGDYANGRSSAEWLLGCYNPSPGFAGHFYWYRDIGQFSLDGHGPVYVSADDGPRSAVGGEKI